MVFRKFVTLCISELKKSDVMNKNRGLKSPGFQYVAYFAIGRKNSSHNGMDETNRVFLLYKMRIYQHCNLASLP